MSSPEHDPLAGRILTIRGQRVILDADLARLYGVSTMAFNQAVRRNWKRFPSDFIMEISHEEHARLISQSVISKPSGRGGRRKAALVFSEHGAIMAATILRSPRAVAMSVYVVRAFVRMREELMTGAVILKRLAEIDKTLLEHDAALRTLWGRLRPLLAPSPEPSRKEMGFHIGIKKLESRRRKLTAAMRAMDAGEKSTVDEVKRIRAERRKASDATRRLHSGKRV